MKHAAIYIKTDKGQSEIAARERKLPRRARALLIMIDGQRSAMDILANSSSVGEVSEFFRLLIDEGYIRELGLDPSVKPPKAAVPPPMPVKMQSAEKTAAASQAVSADGMAELKRYVLLILRDILGNRDAAAFRILIDAAHSPEEIGDIIPLHRDVPWNANSRHRSDDYLVLARRLGQENEVTAGRS
jgi:hypothetical protein